MPKSLCYIKKQYLCTAFEQNTGLWCNGNTADSGPAFPGSSPGSPAKSETLMRLLFFLGYPDSNQERRNKYLLNSQEFAVDSDVFVYVAFVGEGLGVFLVLYG